MSTQVKNGTTDYDCVFFLLMASLFLPFSPTATKPALEIQQLLLKALFFLKATRDTLTAQLITFMVLNLLTSSQGRGLTLFPGTSQGQLPQSPPIFPHQQRTDTMLAGACWLLGELVRRKVLFSGKSAGPGLSCGLPTPPLEKHSQFLSPDGSLHSFTNLGTLSLLASPSSPT